MSISMPPTRSAPAHLRRPARLTVLAGLAALTGLAAGPLYAATEQPHYQVEVVVFAQPAGRSAERPPRQPEPRPLEKPLDEPTEELWDAPGVPVDGDVGAEDDDIEPPFAPASMPRALDRVAAALNRGGYRLLWHQAWVQPALSGEAPSLDELAELGGANVPAGLQGRVSLTAGRFLHLGIDLELHSDAGLEAALQQRRRIRLGVEQYFDHPVVGIIAVVHRLEQATDQVAGQP